MKHVLLSFCLTTAALSTPTPVHITRALSRCDGHGDSLNNQLLSIDRNSGLSI